MTQVRLKKTNLDSSLARVCSARFSYLRHRMTGISDLSRAQPLAAMQANTHALKIKVNLELDKTMRSGLHGHPPIKEEVFNLGPPASETAETKFAIPLRDPGYTRGQRLNRPLRPSLLNHAINNKNTNPCHFLKGIQPVIWKSTPSAVNIEGIGEGSAECKPRHPAYPA